MLKEIFKWVLYISFIFVLCWNISTSSSQIQEKRDLQIGAMIWLKFTDYFIQTFSDDSYNNLVVVSKDSLSKSDANLEQFITFVVSSNKIHLTTILFRQDGSRESQWPAYDICTSRRTFASRTLILMLDIDQEILNWLSQLDRKQFSDCSWLIIHPTNSMSRSIFPLGPVLNLSQESSIHKILEPFEIVPSITLNSKIYLLVIDELEIQRKQSTKKNSRIKLKLHEERTEIGVLVEIYRSTPAMEPSIEKRPIGYKFRWNVLGALVEYYGRANVTYSDIMIEYMTPRQYIWARRRDLYGAELKVSYVELPPYIQIMDGVNGISTGNFLSQGNKTYAGIMIQLFRIIASEINCTFLLTASKDGFYGAKNNDGSWSGMVGELHRKETDLSIAGLSVTRDRALVVDFTNGFLDDDNGLFMLRPSKEFSWTTFTGVFHWKLWLTAAATFVGLVFLFYGIFLIVRAENTITICTTLATVSRAMIALSLPIEGKRIPGRILIFTVCLTGALKWWSFNAGLTSTLTINEYVYPIRTLNDIANNRDYAIVVNEGSVSHDYFDQATERTNRNGWRLRVQDQVKLFPGVSASRAAIMDDPKLVHFAPRVANTVTWNEVPCDVVDVSSLAYIDVSIAWALQKHSPYLELLNFYINILRDGGTIDKILKTHGHGQMLNSKSCTTVNGISGQYGAIAMKNVIFAFAILASGLAVAPLFLYGEKFAKRLLMLQTRN